MSSEKRTTDVTEPTPNADTPLKKKVKTDEEGVEEPEKDTNGAEATEVQSEAASWVPPPFGSICWVQIPATDVARGKKFYEDVFEFKFKPNPPGYKEEDIAMFVFNNKDATLSGGICKADVNSSPSAGTILYFMVDDVDEALKKAEAYGGKTREGKKPEGDHGLLGLFEDTEGNVHGVYQLK